MLFAENNKLNECSIAIVSILAFYFFISSLKNHDQTQSKVQTITKTATNSPRMEVSNKSISAAGATEKESCLAVLSP